MSEHLPECPAADPAEDDDCWHCICDRLRQAEQRVLNKARDAVAPMEAVVLRIAATLLRHPSEDERHDALQRHWSAELKSALFKYRAVIDPKEEQ